MAERKAQYSVENDGVYVMMFDGENQIAKVQARHPADAKEIGQYYVDTGIVDDSYGG